MRSDAPDINPRSRLTLIAVVLAVGGFLAWQAANALLLVFAGLLFGSFLDACTRALGYVLPIGRSWRLAIVFALLIASVLLGLIWGGAMLVTQIDDLFDLVSRQLEVLRGELRRIGLTGRQPDGNRQTLLELVLPTPSFVVDTVYGTLSAATGIFGNVVFVGFVGLFTAANPLLYRRGLLSLLGHSRRERVGEVLDEMAEMLRRWLTGQIIAGTLVAGTTWGVLAMLGLPGAFLLGIQAGVFNFIPYLGPLIATIPIALVATSQSMTMALWATGIQLGIQSLEGYILTPLVMRQAVDLPPVLTLAAILIFGALFGALGVALATPIVAMARIAIIRLYIEDHLGGWHKGR